MRVRRNLPARQKFCVSNCHHARNFGGAPACDVTERVTHSVRLAPGKPPDAVRRDGCANPSSKRLAVCVSTPAIHQAPRIRGEGR